MEKWSSIIESPEYNALDDVGKSALKERYFQNVIMVDPSYNEMDDPNKAALRERFFGGSAVPVTTVEQVLARPLANPPGVSPVLSDQEVQDYQKYMAQRKPSLPTIEYDPIMQAAKEAVEEGKLKPLPAKPEPKTWDPYGDIQIGSMQALKSLLRIWPAVETDIRNLTYRPKTGDMTPIGGTALETLGMSLPGSESLKMSNQLQAMIEKQQSGQKPIEFNKEQWAPFVTRSMTQSTPMMAAAFALSIATGNPYAGPGLFFGTTKADEEMRMIQEGQSPEKATLYSNLYGTIEGGTEMLVFPELFKAAGGIPFKQFVSILIENAGQEAAAGFFEGFTQVFEENTRPDGTLKDDVNLKDVMQQATDAGISRLAPDALAGIGMALPSAGTGLVNQGRSATQAEAQTQAATQAVSPQVQEIMDQGFSREAAESIAASMNELEATEQRRDDLIEQAGQEAQARATQAQKEAAEQGLAELEQKPSSSAKQGEVEKKQTDIGRDYVYHVTQEENIEGIKKTGLDPLKSNLKKVYFSDTEEKARQWAQAKGGMILRVKTPSDISESYDPSLLSSQQPVDPSDIDVYRDGKWMPLEIEKSQPRTWWEFANRVYWEYIDLAKKRPLNDSSLRPNTETVRTIAKLMGVTQADILRAFSVYHAGNPNEEIKALGLDKKPVPKPSSTPFDAGRPASGAARDIPTQEERVIKMADRYKRDFLSKADRKRILNEEGIDPGGKFGQLFTSTWKNLHELYKKNIEPVLSPEEERQQEIIDSQTNSELTSEQRIEQDIRYVYNYSTEKVIDSRVTDIIDVFDKEIKSLGIPVEGISSASKSRYYGNEINRIRISDHGMANTQSQAKVFVGIGDKNLDADIIIPENASIPEIKSAARQAAYLYDPDSFKPSTTEGTDVRGSIGAAQDPALDRKLNQAQKAKTPVYTVQRKGTWVNTKKKPTGGSYIVTDGGNPVFIEGPTRFKVEKQAIDDAQIRADATQQPYYVVGTEKGFVVEKEKPTVDHVEILPQGPGLTRQEQQLLGTKQAQAEAQILQQEGEKIGYKAGFAEALRVGRQRLNDVVMAQKLTDKHRTDALDLVEKYVPKELRSAFTKRILRATTGNQVRRLADRIQSFMAEYDKRDAIRRFKTFVKKTRRQYGRGQQAFGRMRNDVRGPLMDVLDEYGLSELSDKKRQQLESRSDFIRRAAGSMAEAYAKLENIDILQMPNARVEELKRLSQTPIKELAADAIRNIQAQLEQLIGIAERKADIKARTRAERVGRLVNKARQEVAPGGEHSVPVGAVKELSATQQATVRTLSGMFTGKENTATRELLVDTIDRMTKEKKRIGKYFIETYQKMLSDKGITKPTDELKKETSITYGNKTFKIDNGSLLSVYMHIKAEDNLQRLLKSPAVFKYKGKKIRTRRPSLEELRKIVDIVESNPDLKNMAEVYFDHNWIVQAPQVNKTSMEYMNYELARYKKYWHVAREMPVNVEGQKTDISVSIENQGRYQARTGNRYPMRIIPFQTEVINNMQSNAAYIAQTLPMQDIKALIGDPRWQSAMKRAGRESEMKALATMIRRIQSYYSPQDYIEMVGAKALSNFGKSVLSLRLSGYGVQTASVPAAFEVIEPKYFTKIGGLIPSRSEIKEMTDLSPTLWMRWKGKQFDFVIGAASAQNAYDQLVWGKESLTNKFLDHYTLGDQKAISVIYQAAQNKVRAETDLTGLEAKKKAIEITEDALQTQPQWDMAYRSPMTSSPNVFLRGSVMFMSARNAQYNVLMRAADDLQKGRIDAKEFGKRVSGVVYSNILVSIVKRLVKLMTALGIGTALSALGLVPGGPDTEKELKKLAGQVPIDTAYNLIGLSAFGNFVDLAAYEFMKQLKYPGIRSRLKEVRTGNFFSDMSVSATGLIGDIGETIALIKENKDWTKSAMRVADDIAELFAKLTGIPYSAVKSEFYYPVKSATKDNKQKRRTDEEKRRRSL